MKNGFPRLSHKTLSMIHLSPTSLPGPGTPDPDFRTWDRANCQTSNSKSGYSRISSKSARFDGISRASWAASQIGAPPARSGAQAILIDTALDGMSG